jgi:hypothetical protein
MGLKKARLLIAYNPNWKRQSAFGTPMSLSDLTAVMPLENKRWPGTSLTVEEVRGCSGRHLVKRILLARVMRWALEFKVTTQILAGAVALIYGSAASPTGTPADEVQTITIDATGGTFTVAFTFEGLTDTTPAIPYNASAAALQTALENLRSIKAGNVTVTKLGSVFTITFTGDLAKANVPQLVTDAANLTGGAATATPATVTPGVQKLHAVARMTGEQGPAISFVVGFEGHPETYVLYKSVVAADLAVTAERRAIVRATLGVRGSAQVEAVPDFVMPVCQTQDVIRAAQCRAEVDGIFYPDIVRMAYSSSANIFDGDDATPFDGPDVVRLEQGEQWQPTYSLDTYGTNADTLFALGKALAEKAVKLHFGPPGNRVSFEAALAALQLADDELGFSGQASRSTIQLQATPLEVSGAAPDAVAARMALASMLLST